MNTLYVGVKAAVVSAELYSSSSNIWDPLLYSWSSHIRAAQIWQKSWLSIIPLKLLIAIITIYIEWCFT